MTTHEETPSHVIEGLRHDLAQIGNRHADHLNYGQRHFLEVAEEIIKVLDPNQPEATVFAYTTVHYTGVNTATPHLRHPSQTEVKDAVATLLNPQLLSAYNLDSGRDQIWYREFKTNVPGIIIQAQEVTDTHAHEQKTTWTILKQTTDLEELA